jgi:hypothetical protein
VEDSRNNNFDSNAPSIEQIVLDTPELLLRSELPEPLGPKEVVAMSQELHEIHRELKEASMLRKSTATVKSKSSASDGKIFKMSL